ncbi:MAG: hypothetical protein Q8Q59_05700 [Luteolibacter sp.]|nr:hypothetical protein [Luteolibacter sp.]
MPRFSLLNPSVFAAKALLPSCQSLKLHAGQMPAFQNLLAR